MMMNFYYLILALACLQVNSRKCYTCNGVGKTEEENSFGNFFDLSHREEALTAERDESTIDVDLCNNIKGALPERMLQVCPNVDDVCFVEKVYGRLEAAMEMSDGEEDIVEATSTQVTRGCKPQSELTGAFEILADDNVSGVSVLEKGGKPGITKEEVCEEVSTRGLTGNKCTTICTTYDGCNSAGSLKVMLGLTLALFVFGYAF